ncbi:hypothetical protein [Photobacterium damselae]|uniref:Uncharacterized protein n=1 Tax=Photobacterium damselae subsp. damselae TaxID=85581 RepID=A0AAD3WYX9_PHODD|nr:hypothetical protein [Photobacterium damselae]KAB1181461.1 hypothetical protein F6450_08905 [Photobacterium damselae subsp. damselae]
MSQKTVLSLHDLVNSVINHYQFTTRCYAENETPLHTVEFCTSRLQERAASQLNSLADIAYDMGEGELAHLIQLQAQQLEGGLSPMPL